MVRQRATAAAAAVVSRPSGLERHKRTTRYGDRDRVPRPGMELVAKPAQPKLKYQSYFEFQENKDKKKKLEIQITKNKNPQPGFTFVPVGNPELTNACKEISREEDALVFIVSGSKEKDASIGDHVHRIGYHFRSYIVDQAALTLGGLQGVQSDNVNPVIANQTDAIPGTQEEINKQADAAIRDLYPRIPNTDREMIINHAFQMGAVFRGKPVVGLQPNLTLSRRVQLAVIAHIRHTHTRYDRLLRQTDWANARKIVEGLCLDILLKWRGDEETGRDQLDEVLREVVVISDSDDEGEDEDEDEDEGTSDVELQAASERLFSPAAQIQALSLQPKKLPKRPPQIPPSQQPQKLAEESTPSTKKPAQDLTSSAKGSAQDLPILAEKSVRDQPPSAQRSTPIQTGMEARLRSIRQTTARHRIRVSRDKHGSAVGGRAPNESYAEFRRRVAWEAAQNRSRHQVQPTDNSHTEGFPRENRLPIVEDQLRRLDQYPIRDIHPDPRFINNNRIPAEKFIQQQVPQYIGPSDRPYKEKVIARSGHDNLPRYEQRYDLPPNDFRAVRPVSPALRQSFAADRPSSSSKYPNSRNLQDVILPSIEQPLDGHGITPKSAEIYRPIGNPGTQQSNQVTYTDRRHEESHTAPLPNPSNIIYIGDDGSVPKRRRLHMDRDDSEPPAQRYTRSKPDPGLRADLGPSIPDAGSQYEFQGHHQSVRNDPQIHVPTQPQRPLEVEARAIRDNPNDLSSVIFLPLREADVRYKSQASQDPRVFLVSPALIGKRVTMAPEPSKGYSQSHLASDHLPQESYPREAKDKFPASSDSLSRFSRSHETSLYPPDVSRLPRERETRVLSTRLPQNMIVERPSPHNSDRFHPATYDRTIDHRDEYQRTDAVQQGRGAEPRYVQRRTPLRYDEVPRQMAPEIIDIRSPPTVRAPPGHNEIIFID